MELTHFNIIYSIYNSW